MQTGLDRLAEEAPLARLVKGARVGLLSHPASVTRDLVHAIDLLRALGAKVEMIFGPEHGFGGEAQDMIGVADARDAHGTPIRSLYGDAFDDLIPKEADLARIDLLVVDMQDVGARYYTFIWTAVLALRACAKLGKRVLILDRPNPIGGALSSVEGRTQLSGFRSFVGLENIPIRHSLTLGEIVSWRASIEGLPRDALEIIANRGLDRDAHASAWDRPFILPSPNMPTYDTALVYPGGCLLEGTNLSEGRGTTRPFEIFGAPWLDGVRLASEFGALGLPGVHVRALTFRPTFHKHAGETCGGVQVHVSDTASFQPVSAYTALIALCHHQAPDAFRFRTERYEFIDHIPAFDLLTGDSEAREMILRGESPRDVANLVSTLRPKDADIVRAARASLEAYVTE